MPNPELFFQDLTTLNSPIGINGECNFERRFRENKYISLVGRERVDSVDDIAFIFRNLRDEVVENAFVVFLKDRKPTILHLSVGNQNSATVSPDIISLAAKKIEPDEMYFVHNHPTGNVYPSEEDINALETIRSIVRLNPENKMLKVHNIIVNGFSDQYTFIEDTDDFTILKQRIMNGMFMEKEIPVYSADKRVFNMDYKCPKIITKPSDVAEFIYSHRLGNRPNLNALLLSGSSCVGNICLPYSTIAGNETKIASDLIVVSAQFLSERIVIFGSNRYLTTQIQGVQEILENNNFGHLLADAISFDVKFPEYISALENGELKVAEKESGYKKTKKDFISNEVKNFHYEEKEKRLTSVQLKLLLDIMRQEAKKDNNAFDLHKKFMQGQKEHIKDIDELMEIFAKEKFSFVNSITINYEEICYENTKNNDKIAAQNYKTITSLEKKSIGNTDIENLEKVFDLLNSTKKEIIDGCLDVERANSILWIDNWRIKFTGKDIDWKLTYNGTVVIECTDRRAIYTAPTSVFIDKGIPIGDVLQFIEEKTDTKCPQIKPEFGINYSSLHDSRDYGKNGKIDTRGEMSTSISTPLTFETKKEAQIYLNSYIENLKNNENIAFQIETGLLVFKIEEYAPIYEVAKTNDKKQVKEILCEKEEEKITQHHKHDGIER